MDRWTKINERVLSWDEETLTRASRVRGGGEGCAGFEAWCFNAAFNGALLLLFANFHLSTYGGGGGGGGSKGGGKPRTKRA